MVRRKSSAVSSSCNASEQKLKKGGDRVMSVVLWIQLKVGQSEQAEGREAGRNRQRRGWPTYSCATWGVWAVGCSMKETTEPHQVVGKRNQRGARKEKEAREHKGEMEAKGDILGE